MSQNFEELYYKLKEEFEASKKDNDEITKEYESTIEMLTESVETFKKEKEVLEQKLSKLEQEKKNYQKEKESLMNKNQDKIVDIQNLNKQNERLSIEVSSLKEAKNLFDSKIVTLENDNEHFQNKIREYEALAEDLENQLEAALEENITLQTEFETYKQTNGDLLIRKEEELRDIKNDLFNKDKFIQRLQRGNNALLVKNLQKNFKEGGNQPLKRRLTFADGGINYDLSLNLQRNMALKDSSENNDFKEKKEKNEKFDKIRVTKTFDNDNILNAGYRARNSLFTPGFGSLAKLVKQKEELNKRQGNNANGKKQNYSLARKSNKSLLSNSGFDFFSEKKFSEQIDEKSENSESSFDGKDKETGEDREFLDLKISQESNFDYIGSESNGATSQFRILGNEKAIIDNLQKLLERIRKRKTKVIDQRKSNRERIKRLKEN